MRIAAGTRRGAVWTVLVLLLLPAAVWILYAPVFHFELMGDDYQWWQHAHLAMHRPLELLTDLDTFYRPASTWTLVLDRLLFGDSPAAFHGTNLALHALAALLLVAAARRLRLPPGVAVAVGFLWALSPFTDEPAISVAIRFQDLLAIAWLLLVVAWPRREEAWSRGRLAAVAAATLLAAASKESWVVTPGLVLGLEAAAGRRGLRRWIRTAVPFAAAAVLYTAVYFLAFPGSKGYFSADPAVLSKIPHELAAFLQLEQLAPVAFPFDWKGVIATILVAALAVAGWRRRLPAAIVGSALLLLPSLPTVMVPYLPTRYTAIPYAGFLLLAAGWIVELERESSTAPWPRIAVPIVAGAVAALVAAAGLLTVAGDLEDHGRVSDAHRLLLAEASAFPGPSPSGPCLVLRGERLNPLAAVAREPKGLPKLFFVRHMDPYGLIDAAALFEWVGARENLAWERIDSRAVQGRPGAVILHVQGGFRSLEPAADLAAEAERWRANGFPYRIIRPVALAPGPTERRRDRRRAPALDGG